jgi:hypothetical protein
MLRRLRRRFGISAPQVAVRTHVPWYLRIVVGIGLIVLSLVLAWWAYDIGRQSAGLNSKEPDRSNSELIATNPALEEEVARLRGLLAASESSLQIEQSTQKLMSEQNSRLAEENAKLKEDIAVFEKLSKLDGKAADEVTLDRLTIKQEGQGQYRYSFLIALQGPKRGKEAKFALQIVALQKSGAQGDKIILQHGKGSADLGQYEIVLRNFKRIDGKFQVPQGFVLGAVEIKILEAGQIKASKRVEI